MVGRYSGLTSSPLSCSDSLWQVQNRCWLHTFSFTSATSWNWSWKHIWTKGAELSILPCFIRFQLVVEEEDTTQLQMSLIDMCQKQFLFYSHSKVFNASHCFLLWFFSLAIFCILTSRKSQSQILKLKNNSLNKHKWINSSKQFGEGAATANVNDFNISSSEKCQIIVTVLHTCTMMAMTGHYWSPDSDSASEYPSDCAGAFHRFRIYLKWMGDVNKNVLSWNIIHPYDFVYVFPLNRDGVIHSNYHLRMFHKYRASMYYVDKACFISKL